MEKIGCCATHTANSLAPIPLAHIALQIVNFVEVQQGAYQSQPPKTDDSTNSRTRLVLLAHNFRPYSINADNDVTIPQKIILQRKPGSGSCMAAKRQGSTF
jgi:hypothetical protein